ncbi:MAG TPA: class A beta-lactamase [Chthoniobacterales bacterium]|nr:class A beta-lactamase [Chthoniobacterales bacterium]
MARTPVNHFFFHRFAALLLAPTLASSALAADNLQKDAVADFARLEARSNSRIGVSAIDVSTNRRVDYRSEERFIMCSTFKVLAAATVLKRVDENKEKLDRFVRYAEAQLLSYAPVTREHVKEGGMTLEELCAAAVEQSDNTAANLLLEAIGGPEKWTAFARSLGDKFSRLDHNEPDLNIARPGREDDTTTPVAMCADLQRLFTSDVLSVASRIKLEDWMQQGQTGVKMIRAGMPADWKIGDKTGRSGDGATNDIGVLRPPGGGPIFLSIYTVDPAEPQDARDRLVAEVAKAALAALKK